MANAVIMVSCVIWGFVFASHVSISLSLSSTGTITSVDIGSHRDEIMQILKMLLNKENRDFGSSDVVYRTVCGTLQVSKQVVEGILYRVGVKLQPVRKSDFQHYFDCIEQVDIELSKVKFVCFTVWWRAWESAPKDFIVKTQDSSDYSSCLTGNV